MLFIKLDRTQTEPLIRQLYSQIRDAILNGALQSGNKMPSTRKLSKEYGISRNIVVQVYEQLYAEGYFTTEKGSGTYISEGITTSRVYYQKMHERTPVIERDTDQSKEQFNFITGVPDLKKFPRIAWAKAVKNAYTDSSPEILNYGSQCQKFRKSLCHYLHKTKGISCPPEQIFIFPGSSAALSVIFTILNKKGRPVVLEDPVYNGIISLCNTLNIKLMSIPVDEHGMMVHKISPKCIPGFIHVIPSHQFPTGAILSIQRRQQLIEYARKHQIYIVENDYDSEFRYTGLPISSLHVLDPEKVIHIGTFSETMYPGIRIGYMVVPKELKKVCQQSMQTFPLEASRITQTALSSFMDSGSYERHIEKMKRYYKKKHDILVLSLQQVFDDEIIIYGNAIGLFLIVEFKKLRFTYVVLAELKKQGILIDNMGKHSLNRDLHQNKLIFGFGHIDIDRIPQGIQKLNNWINGNLTENLNIVR